MSKNTSALSFRFAFWIPLFIVMLACIPVCVHFGQKDLAKVIGITTVVLTAFALRRWLFLVNKRKGRASKISLNVNDRYWLREHIHFYKALKKSEKQIFEDRISLFLTDIIVTEIGKEIPERETCLYVACSAVITFWGLPYWNYGRLSEVLVYPVNFTEDNSLDESGNILGKVHKGGLMDTTMILSLPALIHGFANDHDKRNVGIHEFAHLIDKADGEIDGLPVGMDKSDREHWMQLCTEEMEVMLAGHSDINIYGATNPAEFFAVIVEYYKESPDLLEKKHPELFTVLDRFFNNGAVSGPQTENL